MRGLKDFRPLHSVIYQFMKNGSFHMVSIPDVAFLLCLELSKRRLEDNNKRWPLRKVLICDLNSKILLVKAFKFRESKGHGKQSLSQRYVV